MFGRASDEMTSISRMDYNKRLNYGRVQRQVNASTPKIIMPSSNKGQCQGNSQMTKQGSGSGKLEGAMGV